KEGRPPLHPEGVIDPSPGSAQRHPGEEGRFFTPTPKGLHNSSPRSTQCLPGTAYYNGRRPPNGIRNTPAPGSGLSCLGCVSRHPRALALRRRPHVYARSALGGPADVPRTSARRGSSPPALAAPAPPLGGGPHHLVLPARGRGRRTRARHHLRHSPVRRAAQPLGGI